MTLSLLYGVAISGLAAFYAAVLLRLARFRRLLPTLREWNGAEPSTWPKVSVIVPCRNEALAVEKAMRSLLAQDYPDLEVVAVDDRSEDETGKILDALALGDRRLSVQHIKTLPDGWLGKNNAMREGSARATGTWLLFTDGDVIFEPGALRRSVAFAEAHGLGHFVALPHFRAGGFLEGSFVAVFMIAFAIAVDPTRLHIAKSWGFVGVGAFGLVRRDAYLKIGGHERLAFEVADDVKLGLLLRRSGVPQACIDSDGLVNLRWQNGFLASLRGLEKNAFAGCEWNTALAVTAISGLLGAIILPWVPIAFDVPEWTRPVAAFVALTQVALVGLAARRTGGGTGLEGALAPFMGLCLAGVMARSMSLALIRRGIIWRGTFYPLDKLRARCVRVLDYDRSTGVGWTPPAPPRRGR